MKKVRDLLSTSSMFLMNKLLYEFSCVRSYSQKQ